MAHKAGPPAVHTLTPRVSAHGGTPPRTPSPQPARRAAWLPPNGPLYSWHSAHAPHPALIDIWYRAYRAAGLRLVDLALTDFTAACRASLALLPRAGFLVRMLHICVHR